MKQILSLLSLSFLLFSCVHTPDFSYDKKKVGTYLAVLESLNKTQYVRYYEALKKSKLDFEHYGINSDQAIYEKDKALREDALEKFYSFDRTFVNWLLSFEKDDKVNKLSKKTALWLEFRSPYSDKITPCMYSTSKAEQAMNLIYAWLRKSEVECLGCPSTKNICMKKAYAGIRSFLNTNEAVNALELQEGWKKHTSGAE